MLNHLKHKHALGQQTPKDVCVETCSPFPYFGNATGQKTINAFAVMADKAKAELSASEFIAAIWARNALPYQLVDDPMFRKQFGVAMPCGFDRHKLSTEMQNLATEIDERILQKVPFASFLWMLSFCR
jgi:hypothetical protein